MISKCWMFMKGYWILCDLGRSIKGWRKVMLLIIFPHIGNIPPANLLSIYIQFIIYSCMDSRKLVLLFQFSEGETSLERLSKFPNITAETGFNLKCFYHWTSALTIVESLNHSLESNTHGFLFLSHKSRWSMSTKQTISRLSLPTH